MRLIDKDATLKALKDDPVGRMVAEKYNMDDGEIYECDNCGVTWQFNDGGPEENEAFYCPKCGFKMVPKEGEADVDRI